MTNKGLGRGFDVLIPKDFDTSLLTDENERVQKLFVSSIRPNPDQPRKHFDQTSLEELASSIKQYGILQPLVVSPSGEEYIIIAGERRYRAAQIAGLDKLPAIVRSTEEIEQLEIALIENVQRVDLSPLEQAASISRLHEQFSMSYTDISKRLGKAVTTINNIVRLMHLPPEASLALRDNKITEGHARSILALRENPAQAADLLRLIQKYGWSVRQAEQFVQKTKRGASDARTAQVRMRTQTPATRNLSKSLQVPVHIRHTAKGGKLEISFSSEAELSRIIKDLTKNS